MKKSHISIIFVIVAVLLLLAGLFFGDLREIYNKAVGICYECIGIG